MPRQFGGTALVGKGLKKRSPKATRPYMPGYEMMFDKHRGSLPWTWAVNVLSKSRNYYLATVRPEGRPHVMPVWGVWLDGAFYFSTGRRSRKYRNLAFSPNCVVCPERADEAVILEGTARQVPRSTLRRFAEAYKKKYDWDTSKNNEPIYAVEPRIIFGFIENPETVKGNPTRWLFPKIN